MKKHALYLAAAAALGLLWFGALMLPSITRKVLLDGGWAPGLAAACLLTVAFATALRTAIARYREVEWAITGAIALSFAGLVLLFWALMLADWVGSPEAAPGTVPEAAVAMLLVAVESLIALVRYAFWVVIPMGILSLWILRKTGSALATR